MSPKISSRIRALSLQRGDILVIQKGFSMGPDWVATLREAGKTAGIDFNVPVVFVDDIDEIAVVRMGGNG